MCEREREIEERESVCVFVCVCVCVCVLQRESKDFMMQKYVDLAEQSTTSEDF